MRNALAGATIALVLAAAPAIAQNVKITPIGSHPGELCANDRATIFEDPTGVRILYDAGHTVTGADDPRLGDIHVVLLSHAHGDHIGDQKLKAVGAGECANSERVPAGPNSMTAEIAAAKNAAIVMTTDMGTFIGRKVAEHPRQARGLCPQTAGATNVPVAAPCRSNTHLGGAFVAKAPDAAQGVEITVVYASHANNVPLSLLSEAQRANSRRRTASCSAADRLRRQVHQRAGRLPFGRHRHPHRDEDGGERIPQGESRADEPRAERGDRDVGRPRDERAGAARGGDPDPRERGRDRRRQAPARVAHRRARQAVRPTPHLAISGRTMEFDGGGRCVAGC